MAGHSAGSRRRYGGSHLNYAIYHDRYQRIAEGWKFAERVYEVRYLDNSPLAGTAPGASAPAPSTEPASGERAATEQVSGGRAGG